MSLRRSTRVRTPSTRYKEPEEKPAHSTEKRPRKPRKGTIQYYEAQAATLPDLGEPSPIIPTPIYTQLEFMAMLGLMPTKRKIEEEPSEANQPESQIEEEQDLGKVAVTIYGLPPEKKPKLDY